MVQFIREQTRQYAADQSGAIETAQLAQNVKEWGDVGQSVGSIAKSIQTQQAKDLKLQEEADEQMINTQIGSKAQTELLKWNVAQIEAGVDPNSDEYTQKLYAKKEELYQPYIDQMTSEKCRSFLQKQGLDTAEKIRQANIGKVAKNRQKAQARAAFVDTANNMKNEAREFGKIGDWEGFKEATEEDRNAMVKYAKANGNKEAAEFAIDSNNITNYLSGMAETDPETVVTILDDKETLKDIVYNELEKNNPNMTEKQKEKAFNELYEKSKQKESADEQLLAVLPDSVLNQYQKSFVAEKKAEEFDIKEKMRELPKDSKSYKSLQKRLEETQAQISDPKDSALSNLRSDLKKTVLPLAKEQLGKNRLMAQKIEEDNVIDTYTRVLNPDTSVSIEAQMALSLGQPAVEQLFQHSISDEEMHRAYDAYAQAKTNVLKQDRVTFEGTQGMADKLYQFVADKKDNKIVQVKDALEFLTEAHNSAITQDQWEDANNIIYGALKDQVFGDMVASVLEDNNRYFPDMPRAFYGSADFVPAQNISDIGLPSTNLSTLDIDSVKNYMDNESVRISKTAMYMLGQAAQIPAGEDRTNAVNQVANYVATEKKKVYDNAMKTYGLDLAKLRENKRNYGQAFTQLSSRVVVEYMGDDPYSGKPLFRQLDNYKEISDARKRILDGLEASKQPKKGKEE